MSETIYILTWSNVSNGDAPLVMQHFPSSHSGVTGLIACKKYKKFNRPFQCKVMTSAVNEHTIRILQKALPCNGEIVVIVHPSVVLPPNFFDVIRAECGDPEILYGAKCQRYNTIQDLHNGDPVTDLHYVEDSSSEIGNEYLQVYINCHRFGPKDKMYPVPSRALSRRVVRDINVSDVFKKRYAKTFALPFFIDFVETTRV